MKQLALLAGSLLLSSISFSQHTWEEMMLEPNSNFYEIRNSFNASWEGKDPQKGEGYKQFRRWENFWETRVLPDGSFPMYNKEVWAEFKSTLMAPSVKSGGIGNWSPIGPFDYNNTNSWSPGMGRINIIVEDPTNPNIIYVGAPAGGIWKTTDGGTNWTPLGDEFSVIGVSSIAIDPNNSNTIYVGTGDTDAGDTYAIGVMKSTDGGTTWANVGSVSANEISDILVDPSNSNVVYAATNAGLLKSTNGGNSFTNILSGSIRDIEFKPGTPSTIYAVDPDDFFVSTNSGATWNNTTNGLPNAAGRLAIAVTPANSSYVYLLAAKTDWSYQGVYRSTNSGTSFTAQNTATDIFDGSTQAWYDMAICASPTNANTVITGCLNVWKSTNGGSSFSVQNSWSNPGGAAYTHADIHCLKYYNGNLYCGSDGGIYVSTNNASAFTDITPGLQIGQFYRLAGTQSDMTRLAGGLQDNGGYAFVNNEWRVYYGADGMEAGINPTDPTNVFGMIQYGDLYESANSGTSSTGRGSPEQGRWVTPMDMDPSGTRLLAGYTDLYEFTFAGAGNWNQLSTFSFPDQLRSVEVYNSNTIFVGTNYKIYKTSNNGSSFTDITGSISAPSILTSIEVNPSDDNEIWITFGGWTAGNHVYHTTNGGANWTNITGALPNLPCNIVKFDPAGAGGIYVGTDIGVYFRDNSSGVWVEYNNNLPNVIVNDLEINYANNVIRAGTYGRGVWSSDVFTINDYDIGISAVVVPAESYCNENSFDPVVTMTNYGLQTITSATITYNLDGGTPLVYNWTGSLAQGQSVDIALPTMSTNSGSHSFNVSTSLPNGFADEEPNNDSSSKSFTVVLGGVTVTFNLTPDCWGAEVTWEIVDGGGTQVLTGGPYSDGAPAITVSNDYCIQPGCYDFTIYDGYGDGMYGSQYGSCNDDGYYNLVDGSGTILMELIAPNADYGSVEYNSFCVSGVLTASAEANNYSVCEGSSVDFTDLSIGTPTSWEWIFDGGSPGTSNTQNPSGILYTNPGNYDVTLIVGDGTSFDTTVIVNMITVNGNTSGSESQTACNSYTWSANGTTYTSSGSYTATLANANGCDSVATLNLTINSNNTGSESVTSCGNYTWAANGNTYTSSGSYTATLTNVGGCDSVATLNLTIASPNSGSESASACGSYTWAANGQTYTSTGNYTTVLSNINGCDSTATLNLTINGNTSSTQTASACSSYTWSENGQTYTSSGAYTTTLTNANGCDSIITLNLTINTPDATVDDVTACLSYTWSANGQTYTSNGTYTATLTNVDGCDSVVTLNLTISTSASTTQNVNACSSYTWSANGTTYTSGGTFVETLTSSTGCDSTVTLNLTINLPNSGSESLTACNSYTWGANGQTYTSSGTYTATLTNQYGCDSVATLNLTINGAIAGNTNFVSSCNSYTWPINGQTYTNSGVYTSTLVSSQGCDSIVTLDLTIGTSNSGSESVSSCDSYTWSANGNTYLNSGTYSTVLTNQSGCDSTAILNLTINQSTSASVSQTACESYTWNVDGNTYNTSGNYTATISNSYGCDSIITLNLTINQSDSMMLVIETCDEYTWFVNGVTYTTTGLYSETYTNADGCDSTRYLNLVINTANVGVTVIDDTVLQADATGGAMYQWIDCSTNTDIDGETNQSYSPNTNGTYAVVINDNGCVDTSSCITIAGIGIIENEFGDFLSVYPNPTEGELNIEFGDKMDFIEIELYNSIGQVVRRNSYTATANVKYLLNEATGVYFIRIKSNGNEANLKILKK